MGMKIWSHLIWLLLGGMFFGMAVADEPAAPESTPAAVVERLHENLLEGMRRGDEWDYARRFEQWRPVISESHHFPLISRVVLGAHWAELTEDEQGRFVDALRNLAVASYAAEFDRHRGERFRVVAEQELREDQVLVRAQFERPERSDIRFDYVLAWSGGRWGIINVIADGVSDLSLKRAEYQAVLRQRDFRELMRELERQIADLGGVPGGEGNGRAVD